MFRKVMKRSLPNLFTLFSLGLASIFSAAGSVATANAAELCPNPKPDYPAISFGMTGLGPGYCKTQLDRARYLGFTAVSMSPSFFFQTDGTVTPGMQTSDLLACFDYAKSLGFDIIYKPMIEAPYVPPVAQASPTATPIPNPHPGPKNLADALMEVPNQSNAPWRAYFDFHPGADYLSKAIEPFLHWIEINQVHGSSEKFSLVVATEMHRSLIEYPDEWNNLMWNTQQRLKSDGLAGQVQVGLDPTVFGTDSWLPPYLTHPLTANQCTRYETMLWTADFFSSSVYGDFVAAGFKTNPAQAVQTMYTENESNWEAAVISRGCAIDPMLSLRFKTADRANRDQGRADDVFWPGEIGYAGALNRTWSGFDTDPPYAQGPAAMQTYRETKLVTEQQEFITTAPLWVKGILDSARGSDQDFISFWITGRYDLFGFSDLPPLGTLDSYEGEYTSVDPVQGPDAIPAVAQLRDMLQQYTRDRCAGWQPALPAARQ
jgi:hypothetical protein